MTGPVLVVVVVLGALAGGAVGSYTGAVASRGWRRSLGGRSICDSCARELRWWELVPVMSWLALRGRCARCGTRIPVSLLVREAVGAVVGACLVAIIAGR
jgi:leader peptidase (prepilin peptidase)/N-methyltransferase